jgi:glycosyltransferase A (GT-A) superfamily protein (DUF2064 family)
MLVLAKEPVPGLVKTRLCPPCSPEQAARIARAALDDTLDAIDECEAGRRMLIVQGRHRQRPNWDVLPQRGHGLAERIVAAFADASRLSGMAPTMLIGMDTPQIRSDLIGALTNGLADADAALGPAVDGGWWGLALRDASSAAAVRDIPMSTADTCRLTAAALRARGLRLAVGPCLRDVDTAEDARIVAAECPETAFAAAVRAIL